MPGNVNIKTDKRRRSLLLGGLAAGTAGLLQVACRSSQTDIGERVEQNKLGSNGAAAVPPHRVNVAAFGGKPGAAPAALRLAFERAFSALKQKGGGTLLVPPGLYDFGRYAEGEYIILCRGLRDIAVSAYGATFQATTTARVMPHMFYFVDFNNITIAGARFTDPGFTPLVDWKGMYCVGIQAERESSGFRMVECHAERVVGLLSSNNNASTRNLMSRIHIQGKVCEAYYGVAASYIREQVRVELDCHNVRRAFIAYALRNAEIIITASSLGSWPGSNGLIALVCSGARMGNVENVRIHLDVSGAVNYAGYIHFYHQGPERDGYMRNIDATVNVVDVSAKPSLFLFDHETNGVQEKTTRVWDAIALRGSVKGKFSGRIIANPSVSVSPGSVHVDARLSALADLPNLPSYFSKKVTAIEADNSKGS